MGECLVNVIFNILYYIFYNVIVIDINISFNNLKILDIEISKNFENYVYLLHLHVIVGPP